MCQLFNVGAALALRAWMRERHAVIRLPGGGLVRPEGVRLIQSRTPPPSTGLSIGFIFQCASRGIGYTKPRLMGATHTWILMLADPSKAESVKEPLEVSVDFAAAQFGLGSPLDSSRWVQRVPPDGKHCRQPSASTRAWVAVEPCPSVRTVENSRGLKLPPPQWTASAMQMSSLDSAGARGCGLHGCSQCRGCVIDGGGQDPISAILSVPSLVSGIPGLTESADSKGKAHGCRIWRQQLLQALREGTYTAPFGGAGC